MTNKLDSFLTNIGVLCETWTIVYKNFIGQGMEVKDALAHTQSFMTAFMNGMVNHEGGKK